MRAFRDLVVWRKAHKLALAIYVVTEELPGPERYGLTSQIRRAATSVPANIAEGCGRSSDREFKRFLDYAMGSASELEYHLLLAKDLEFMDVESWEELSESVVEVKRMLTGLSKRLRAAS